MNIPINAFPDERARAGQNKQPAPFCGWNAKGRRGGTEDMRVPCAGRRGGTGRMRVPRAGRRGGNWAHARTACRAERPIDRQVHNSKGGSQEKCHGFVFCFCFCSYENICILLKQERTNSGFNSLFFSLVGVDVSMYMKSTSATAGKVYMK